MPPTQVFGVAATVGLGLMVYHILQVDRTQRQPVQVCNNPTRKDQEWEDRRDASGVSVRECEVKLQRRGEHNRENRSENEEPDAREYLYEVRKLQELFPAATLDTCRGIFETNKGNLDECIDFLLKHHDNLNNARNAKVLPVSDVTVVTEKVPEVIPLDSKPRSVTTTPVPEVDLKAKRNREELLCELSYLNALEQEIERKKAALQEEELALQALQSRVHGLKSIDVGSSSSEQVFDSEVPMREDAAPTVSKVSSAHGVYVLCQDAVSMVLPIPASLANELPISELSKSEAAITRAISEQSEKGSTDEVVSLVSRYSEQTNDSPNQMDDDLRSESSWSDLGAGSIGADEQ